MKSPGIVCVGALRSPMGRFGGSFKKTYVYDLAAPVITELVESLHFTGSEFDEVIIGNCRQAGNGPNPARTASVRGGIPQEVPVTTINMACPSGMKALELAAMRLLLGEASYILVGGMESMSTMPFLLKDVRWDGFKMGNKELLDGWADSIDPLIGQGMGQTAENLVEKYGISRETQDEFAATSHEKANKAWENGYFSNEVVPIQIDDVQVDRDETIRFPVNREKLGKLRPVFKKDGTVTAANACAMADGASFMVLTTKDIAMSDGLPVLGELQGFAQAAVSPEFMGEGPADVIPALLKENSTAVDSVDLFEVNEAFAIQILANEQIVGWERDKLNIHGGAIALGHPTGCSGVRIVTTLLHALNTHDKATGVASLCGAGGVTMATLVKQT